MLILNGFPRPYPRVFNLPRFGLVSQERFFLVIEADDPQFNRDKTKGFLSSLPAREVAEIKRPALKLYTTLAPRA